MKQAILIITLICFLWAAILPGQTSAGGIGTSDRPSGWTEILIPAAVILAVIYGVKYINDKRAEADQSKGSSLEAEKTEKL